MLAGGFSLLGLIAATIIIIPMLTNLFASVLERVYGSLLGNEEQTCRPEYETE